VSSPSPATDLSLGNGPPPFNRPLLFVIPSVPGFPTSPLSPTTTYVVLLKENHMQLTEAATLDRKSGRAEGSAVRHSGAPHLQVYGLTTVVFTLREGVHTIERDHSMRRAS
jgi:hypothetical protein